MPRISPIKKSALTMLALPVALSLAIYANFGSINLQANAMVGSLDSPMDLRLSAMESLLKGDKERALSLYSTAIEAAAKQYGANSGFLADLYYEAGTLASKQDLFDKADTYLHEAVKINPRLSMARMELADLDRRRQKPMEALEQIQSDLAAHPESVIARQQFVRWLASNGSNAQDGSIAHQESLRILAMSTQAKSVKFKDDLSRMVHRAGSQSTAGDSTKQQKPEQESSTGASGESESGSRVQPMMSLPTRPNIKSDTELKAEKEKAETQKKEAEQRAREDKDKERKKEERAREEREREAREKESRAREAARAKAANKTRTAKSKATKSDTTAAAQPASEAAPQEKPKAVKAAKEATPVASDSATSESEAKAEARSKKSAKSRQAQEVVAPSTGVLPALQPNFYAPVPVYSPPVPRGKPKPGFVAPPPPTAFPSVFGGGMAPQMPMVVQTPAPVVKKAKPKPPVKKVEEAPKEAVDDKPPPMNSAGSESDPEFLLDWADVHGKKKKGR